MAEGGYYESADGTRGPVTRRRGDLQFDVLGHLQRSVVGPCIGERERSWEFMATELEGVNERASNQYCRRSTINKHVYWSR